MTDGRQSALLHPYGPSIMTHVTDTESEGHSVAAMYQDQRVVATVDDYPDEPVGEDFTGRSHSTA